MKDPSRDQALTADVEAPASLPRPCSVRYVVTSRSPSALLRMCLRDGLTGWAEERSQDVQRQLNDWYPGNAKKPKLILWIDKRDRTGTVTFQPKQLSLGIMSRIDGMMHVANKSETERCLELCRNLGLRSYDHGSRPLSPMTWLLPEERTQFETFVRARRLAALAGKRSLPTYIIKPSGGSQGAGIFLLRHERQVPSYAVATSPRVAQEYIDPMLLEGKKFDLRLYVLVRSVDPLEVYVHKGAIGIRPHYSPSCAWRLLTTTISSLHSQRDSRAFVLRITLSRQKRTWDARLHT